MSLFLAEFSTDGAGRAELKGWVDRVADAVGRAGGSVVEAQVAVDLKRVYVVIEHSSREAAALAVADVQPPPSDVAEVRLVGTSLEEVKASKGSGNYLVEWDLPAGLDMDRYLARKKEKSPLYAQVPEVKFLRTYVREDMARCLCFYDALDQDAVVKARQVVQAPVDRLTRVENWGKDAS
jgi:Protein of unknown function (DUF4242)